MDKISVKNDTNAIITCCLMSDRPIQSMQIMHIDSLSNMYKG